MSQQENVQPQENKENEPEVVSPDIFFEMADEYGYDHRAFVFVYQALLDAIEAGGGGHVKAEMIADKVRENALKNYGSLALEVLRYWRVHTTSDIGRIVEALVEKRLCLKSEEDRFEDFENLYDFDTVFRKEYQIGQNRSAAPAR